MKTLNSIISLGLIIGILLFASCESDKNIDDRSGFRIEISDGNILTGEDILYYDSSSCTFFLKDLLFLSYKETEHGNQLENQFTVFVDDDTIYKGIIYPDRYVVSAMPPLSYIIERDFYDLDRSILEIKFAGFASDLRNDPRIIAALKDRGLLCRGITLTIDNIEILDFFPNDSAHCEITIHNPDPINYYMLDPQKMGEAFYNYYNKGLVFTRHGTGYESEFDGIYHSEYGTITEEDFSLLPSNGSLTFEFTSTDYSIAFSGIYKCAFCLRYRDSNINLNQPNGRIWIGNVCSSIDDIVVEIEYD